MNALGKHNVFRKANNVTFAIQALAEIATLAPKEVLKIAEDIVDQLADAMADSRSHLFLDAQELIRVALALQRQVGKYRTRGLTIFEKLLERGAYGSEAILDELDGRRNSAARVSPARRLGRQARRN
ncbi:MAG: hypothetical protein EXQ90_08625 [Rhodospirillales bacterium]|nr:hypothetical protein [Rhodospirillales bacterium]